MTKSNRKGNQKLEKSENGAQESCGKCEKFESEISRLKNELYRCQQKGKQVLQTVMEYAERDQREKNEMLVTGM